VFKFQRTGNPTADAEHALPLHHIGAALMEHDAEKNHSAVCFSQKNNGALPYERTPSAQGVPLRIICC